MTNLAGLDFKLLQVFEALMLERNVSRAAQRVAMAQPSLSSALSRLRLLFGDELFVRTPKGMRPTARALALADPIAGVLGQVRKIVAPDGAFDPEVSERRFVLGVAPFATYVLIPAFIALFRREAPNASICFRSLELQDEAQLLDEARIDLAVGIVVDLPKRFGTCRLFQDRPVCIARRSHPELRQGLTLERFVALPHAHATHYLEALVDAALAQQGLVRRVAVIGHNYRALGLMIASSDLLAIVPARAAADLARREDIEVHEIPLALAPQPIGLAWSKHGDSDRAVRWLRDRIRDVTGEAPP
jgi:DNA-binding transcriptional LysR family regulator